MEELNRALFCLLNAPRPDRVPLAIATFFAEYAIWLIPSGFVAVWLRAGDGARKGLAAGERGGTCGTAGQSAHRPCLAAPAAIHDRAGGTATSRIADSSFPE